MITSLFQFQMKNLQEERKESPSFDIIVEDKDGMARKGYEIFAQTKQYNRIGKMAQKLVNIAIILVWTF